MWDFGNPEASTIDDRGLDSTRFQQFRTWPGFSSST
jgi:hypothetical protein